MTEYVPGRRYMNPTATSNVTFVGEEFDITRGWVYIGYVQNRQGPQYWFGTMMKNGDLKFVYTSLVSTLKEFTPLGTAIYTSDIVGILVHCTRIDMNYGIVRHDW